MASYWTFWRGANGMGDHVELLRLKRDFLRLSPEAREEFIHSSLPPVH